MVPEKCMNCKHGVTQFENVHKGWLKYRVEPVMRCECSPTNSIVGCVVAEITCKKKRGAINGRTD